MSTEKKSGHIKSSTKENAGGEKNKSATRQHDTENKSPTYPCGTHELITAYQAYVAYKVYNTSCGTFCDLHTYKSVAVVFLYHTKNKC